MELWTLILLFTTSQAAVILTQRNPDDNGASVTFQNQDDLGQYDFGYNEGHPSGASFRRESGDAFGNKIGSFGLRDADGRIRVVRYVADSNGFRAEVTSNEPGVAPQDPASATINKPAVVAVPSAPVVPVAQVAAYPPPPPPSVVVASKVYSQPPPPPPPAYSYGPAAVAVPGPPPPPPPPPRAYFPPRSFAPVATYSGPIASYPAQVAAYPAPVAAYPAPVAPVAVAPVAKGIAAYPPPPPPPPPPYYTNLVQGKNYVTPLRSYPSLAPPFAAVPPQFGYLTLKSPPYYQALGNPL